MSRRRADLVVIGQVVVVAHPDHLERADAVAISGDRVVAVGSEPAMRELAGPDAELIDGGDRAVVPGVTAFHLHLVGMARARHSLQLDVVPDFDRLLAEVASAAALLPDGAWLTGRGWSEALLDHRRLDELARAAAGTHALLVSHDGHSAWASPAALAAAGIDPSSPDPPGGRIEREESGAPTGVLRERAMDLVGPLVDRLSGDPLRAPLSETVAELAALGVTAATDAGDATDDNGRGAYASLGDSFSSAVELREVVDERLRLTLNLPADAIAAAGELGLHTGLELGGTLRVGWAKAYADGALGSGTAALFEADTCGGDSGILRFTPAELEVLLAAGRARRIGLAIHAIGDRANAAVLDAIERAPRRPGGVPADRIEHAQLVRMGDRERFAQLGIIASMQPIHAAADRERVEACWADRVEHAYAWRSLAAAGVRLAFGSDAPVESVNPWEGIFAAVHRRFAHEDRAAWTPNEALDVTAALSAYTLAPARALGRRDEGHLRVGARADLAVLDVDLATLLAADQRLASVRSRLTLVDGREVHRS
jgi:predicted amidohydrolase YtcJ